MSAIPDAIDSYNVVWTTPSQDSSESMPCGGGGIGLNVWVENGDVLFYIDRSGSFDENNQMLKLGRVRLTLSPNPFAEGATFRQELKLRESAVEIEGRSAEAAATIRIWIEVFRPVIHVDVLAAEPVSVRAAYETWRTENRPLSAADRRAAFTFAWTAPERIPLYTYADTVQPEADRITWWHQNDNTDLAFDKVLIAQHLDGVKDRLWNPQKDFLFGGMVRGGGLQFMGTSPGEYAGVAFTAWNLETSAPQRDVSVRLFLHAGQFATIEEWTAGLQTLADEAISDTDAWAKNVAWWQPFWDRSAIVINGDSPDPENVPWQIGRNYQLFRYTLGCNAYGEYPSKFNGSLFTYDSEGNTPDFRAWGGGSFTAQNQRLVHFPMLKSGDFDLMTPQFEFYRRALVNAEIRTEVYWGHGGASFTEQMENYGLPCGDIYERFWGKRPVGPRPGDDHGKLLNAWCEDQYDTVLEFCLMILDAQRYSGADISRYLPLLESCATFFDEHYRAENKKRTGRELDDDGKLVIFPGSACETYKEATNSVTTVAGLMVVLDRMLELPDNFGTPAERAHWRQMRDRIPPISFREMQGHCTISPAKSWTRINNQEFPQMYPVFPFRLYGVGRPDLRIAIDTFRYGTDRDDQHGVKGWKQDPIFAACLGLTDEAATMVAEKLADAPRRFPTFWGPNFDWTPDFNHGGSGAIALQEMLLQADGRSIYLLPAWPTDWDVHFKLHAPYETVVEGVVKNGKLQRLEVSPPDRAQDVITLFPR